MSASTCKRALGRDVVTAIAKAPAARAETRPTQSAQGEEKANCNWRRRERDSVAPAGSWHDSKIEGEKPLPPCLPSFHTIPYHLRHPQQRGQSWSPCTPGVAVPRGTRLALAYPAANDHLNPSRGTAPHVVLLPAPSSSYSLPAQLQEDLPSSLHPAPATLQEDLPSSLHPAPATLQEDLPLRRVMR